MFAFYTHPVRRRALPTLRACQMAQHHDLVSEIDVRQCWALNENKEEQATLPNCLSAELRMPPPVLTRKRHRVPQLHCTYRTQRAGLLHVAEAHGSVRTHTSTGLGLIRISYSRTAPA